MTRQERAEGMPIEDPGCGGKALLMVAAFVVPVVWGGVTLIVGWLS